MSSHLKNSVVLVADDHPVNLALMQYLLQQAGAIVFAAADGNQLMSNLLLHPEASLLLLDVQMPGKNGKQCAAEIRQQSRFNNIKLVAISAENDEHEKLDCLHAGFDAYLVKPLSLDKLNHIMDSLNGNVLTANKAKAAVTIKPLLLSYLDMVSMHDSEMAMEIINETRKTAPSLIAEIDNAISTKSYLTAAAHLHKLKGLIAIMEFEPLLEKIKATEHNIKELQYQGLYHWFNLQEWQYTLHKNLEEAVAVVSKW
jgi:CheY-like chemotaxis protein